VSNIAGKIVYYGSKLSEHLTKTPEGFLICHSVPIGRLGTQDYLANEIGLDSAGQVTVLREEGEVFAPAAVASFEGKPFTDEHPFDMVTTENVGSHLKGMVHNVHRGSGNDKNMLMADIVIYDKEMIRQVERGKREVSCGYYCEYEGLGSGRFKQASIRGNHVALVERGRAGKAVAIKDSISEDERRKRMSAKKEKIMAAMDSIADVIAEEEGVKANVTPPPADETAIDNAPPPPPTAPPAPAPAPAQQSGDQLAQLTQQVAMLTQLVQKLAGGQGQPEPPKNALDALEEELLATDDEESTVIEAEEVSEEEAKDSAVKLIRRIKPALAGIKDPAQRKLTTDTFAALLRQSQGLPQRSAQNSYAQIQQAAIGVIKAKTSDSYLEDEAGLGRKWAEMYNPHYKKEVK
jgi:hypothetical protein